MQGVNKYLISQVSIALLLLFAPVVVLCCLKVRDGMGAVRPNLVLISLSAVALVLLGVLGYITWDSGAYGLLNTEFFPSKAYLLFLVSGFAFGAAIFPRQVIELVGMPSSIRNAGLDWLFAVPAWLWIIIVFVLIATNYAG